MSKVKKKMVYGSIDDTFDGAIVCCGGDVLITDNLPSQLGDEFQDVLFSKLNPTLKKCNLVFANLESPITKNSVKNPEKNPNLPFMKISQEVAGALKNAPFHLLQIANNHIMDYDTQGLVDTIKFLEKNGIHYIGAGENSKLARLPYIVEIDKVRIGFLAYSNAFCNGINNPGCAPINIKVISEDILKVRSECDLVIIGVHQGIVYSDYPVRDHMRLYRNIIDSGADIIVGHHPHVLQGWERYNDGLIAYSLNSIVLDYSFEKDQEELRNSTVVKNRIIPFTGNDKRPRESVLLMLGIRPDRVIYDFIPIVQKNDHVPEIADVKRSKAIMDRVKLLSAGLTDQDKSYIDELEHLFVNENIDDFFSKSVKENIMRLHKIRLKHLSIVWSYIKKRFIQT